MKIIFTLLLIVSCSTTIQNRHQKLSGDELLIIGKAAKINNKQKKAKVYIKRSCEKGSLEACWLYTDYMNSYHDRERVKAIMNKACKEGLKLACPSEHQRTITPKATDEIRKKQYNVTDDTLAHLLKGVIELLTQ